MRTASNAAHVKSVLWLLLNMLQHVLGNNFQCNFLARQIVNKETPPHWRLLAKTCCSMFRRSQSTDFTCAALEAVGILNICKIFHEIQVLLNFLFKFTRLNLVLVNINPVEFNLIRQCSFCNISIYMSNDVKFFETPSMFFYSYQLKWNKMSPFLTIEIIQTRILKD